jgi:hypothetical protein
MMEDREGSVESEDSSALTDVDPVENMVAIPVPAPGVVIYTLVPVDIPQEFIPPVLCANLLEPEGAEIACAGFSFSHLLQGCEGQSYGRTEWS